MSKIKALKLKISELFILYSRKEQADIGRWNREEKRVHSVKGTAMARDKVGEILYTYHSLEQGLRQIAYLTKG